MIENKSQIYYVSKQDEKIISENFLSVTAKKTNLSSSNINLTVFHPLNFK